MCCLFGIMNYGGSLTAKQKNRLLSALAASAKVRGADATGIAYHSGGRLRIYKRPWPADRMRFHVPGDANATMGHTRMATQGSARRNCNNHPFQGNAGGEPFALAHNGVLYNDKQLRQTKKLPATNIETDSYIAVQLIEQQRALGFSSLRNMAEQVLGSFVFTVLDRHDRLYIVKGDNPLCLWQFPAMGLYVYASTEEILRGALSKVGFLTGKPVSIPLRCGEILRIGAAGELTRQAFDDSRLSSFWYDCAWWGYGCQKRKPSASQEDEYLEEIKAVAMSFGYAPEDIDRLVQRGFTPEEIEEVLYIGEV
ncbi:MAG: class II glutamine amidotransferase [Oscillospiraceae bacterium]